jgi:hypothetical protein
MSIDTRISLRPWKSNSLMAEIMSNNMVYQLPALGCAGIITKFIIQDLFSNSYAITCTSNPVKIFSPSSRLQLDCSTKPGGEPPKMSIGKPKSSSWSCQASEKAFFACQFVGSAGAEGGKHPEKKGWAQNDKGYFPSAHYLMYFIKLIIKYILITKYYNNIFGLLSAALRVQWTD